MKKDIMQKLIALITAAFGLVAALAWNGAIQTIFAKYYAVGEGVWSMLIYAVVVTIIAVAVILGMGKMEQGMKK